MEKHRELSVLKVENGFIVRLGGHMGGPLMSEMYVARNTQELEKMVGQLSLELFNEKQLRELAMNQNPQGR